MPISPIVVNFTFATGATTTNTQFVGNAARCMMYVSNMTGWASAAGNSKIVLRGSHASGVSHVSIPGASITTETLGAMYDMSQAAGVPYLSVGFVSITSGAGTISVMLGQNSY
jgi:hypothetical protein